MNKDNPELFARRDRARLKPILCGRSVGIALKDIRQWLLIYENGGAEVRMRATARHGKRAT